MNHALAPLSKAINQHPALIDHTHFVVDIETFGKPPCGAIAAIGCIRIDHGTITANYYARVSLMTSMVDGGQVDASTIQFWLKQSLEARSEVDGTMRSLSISVALQGLADFINSGPHRELDHLVWGKGPNFDNTILEGAYQRCGIPVPWKYNASRCMRTMLSLYPSALDIKFQGTPHHALDDARHEAVQFCAALALHTAAHSTARSTP